MGLRAAGLFPEWFIAFFYTGLGLALSLAGASYIARGVRGRAWGVPRDQLSVSRVPGQGLVNGRGLLPFRGPSARWCHAITASGGINLAVMLDGAGVVA